MVRLVSRSVGRARRQSKPTFKLAKPLTRAQRVARNTPRGALASIKLGNHHDFVRRASQPAQKARQPCAYIKVVKLSLPTQAAQAELRTVESSYCTAQVEPQVASRATSALPRGQANTKKKRHTVSLR